MATPYEEAVKELLAEGYIPDQGKLSVSVEPLGNMPSLDPMAQAEAELLAEGYIPASGSRARGFFARQSDDINQVAANILAGIPFGETIGEAFTFPNAPTIASQREALEQSDPKTAIAAKIAGALMPLAAGPMASGANLALGGAKTAIPQAIRFATGLNKAGQTSRLGRLGWNIGQGAEIGALYGAEDALESGDPYDILKEAGMGAGMTAALGIPVEGIGAGVHYLTEGAKDAARALVGKYKGVPAYERAAKDVLAASSPEISLAYTKEDELMKQLAGIGRDKSYPLMKEEQRGNHLRSIFNEELAQRKDLMSEKFTQASELAGDAPIKTRSSINKVLNEFGGLGLDTVEAFAKRIGKYGEPGKITNQTLGELMKLRSLASKGSRSANGVEQLAYQRLTSAIDESIERAVTAKAIPKKAANLYEKGRAERFDIEQTFNELTGGKFVKTTKTSQEAMDASDILSKFKTAEDYKQAFKMAGKQAPRLKRAIREFFMQDLAKVTNLAEFNQWEKKLGIGADMVFTQTHRKTVKQIAKTFNQKYGPLPEGMKSSVASEITNVLGSESPTLGGLAMKIGLGAGGFIAGLGVASSTFGGTIGVPLAFAGLKVVKDTMAARSLAGRKEMFRLLANPKVAELLAAPPTKGNIMKALVKIGEVSQNYGIPSKAVLSNLPNEKKKTESDEAMTETSMPKKPSNVSSLVDAVIKAESAGRANAVSPKGAQGLMQLMPATGKEMHQKLGLPGKYDPFDKEQNKAIGTAYLNEQLRRFGDVKLALAAYNGGPNYVKRLMQKYGNNYEDIEPYLWDETRNYVKKVTRYS